MHSTRVPVQIAFADDFRAEKSASLSRRIKSSTFAVIIIIGMPIRLNFIIVLACFD